MPSVPRLFPGSTIVCVASGPSLTAADVNACHGVVPVVTVNDGYRLAPWADVLYACDSKWWEQHKGVPKFTGLKYSLESRAGRWPGVQVLRNTGDKGLEIDPTGLRTGRNSGYQAVNLAVHLGAKRILLLGYDMQPTRGRAHFYDDRHQHQSPYALFREHFKSMVEPLKELGVTVINCTRETALNTFPCQPIEDALAKVAA